MIATSVDADALATYLNDHLAGSVAGIDLIDGLCKTQAGTPLAGFLQGLRAELVEEQRVLRALVEAFGSVDRMSQAIAWLGEKVSRLKIGHDSGDTGGLALFETLEALSLGFWGRRCLWLALDELAQRDVLPSDVDFLALARRVELRLEQLEDLRIDASLRALTRPERDDHEVHAL